MAAIFVLHRTSSLKWTGVNALSFPVHFNRSILKLLNMGTTVKKELDAQIFRICFYQGNLIPDIQKT